MMTVKRMAKSLGDARDETDIKFAEGSWTIVGVVRGLLAKCPPGARLVGWHVDDKGEITGVAIEIDGKHRTLFGRTRKMRGAMGRILPKEP